MENAVLEVSPQGEREILVERVYDAPIGRVFRALTEPAEIAGWIASESMPLVACEMDFRGGGLWRMVYQRKNGQRLEVRGEYAEVAPPHRWSTTESYDFSPLELKVETSLREESGKTRLTIALRYASRQERDDDFPGVASSAREAYERLAAHLAAGAA